MRETCERKVFNGSKQNLREDRFERFFQSVPLLSRSLERLAAAKPQPLHKDLTPAGPRTRVESALRSLEKGFGRLTSSPLASHGHCTNSTAARRHLCSSTRSLNSRFRLGLCRSTSTGQSARFDERENETGKADGSDWWATDGTLGLNVAKLGAGRKRRGRG